MWVVLGLQWGDEAKGKFVDYLAGGFDAVVRYQGGANAGHTVIYKGKKVPLHLIPSGIFHPGCTCVIGNGVVLDPEAFVKEIKMLEELGIETKGRVWISDRAHLTLPYHKRKDEEREERRKRKIGTTRRGIGPTYMDKYGRTGIRAGDLFYPEYVKERLSFNVENPDEVFEFILSYRDFLLPYITDAVELLHRFLEEGKRILFEGAQGTMLDVDFGTYPFVTSSNPTAGGVCTGTGIPPTAIEKVIGVAKAYTTRIGEGPLPTEFPPEFEERIREKGNEFGATTGRPRRCGWFDAFQVRYAVKINGVREMVLTKLDVLDGIEIIKIATGYRLDGVELSSFPSSPGTLERVEVIYEEIPGWEGSVKGIKRYEDLPHGAKRYIKRIEEVVGARVKWISTGPEREEIIHV